MKENTKPREFWIDKDAYDENLETKSQGIIAYFKKPSRANKPIHVREVVPLDWIKIWQSYNKLKLHDNPGPRALIQQLVEAQLKGET